MTEHHTHGTEGAFVGGDWSSIEDCASNFEERKKSCGGDCSTCPRSKTKTNAANLDGTYDVVIIGAGCIGGAIARELSKTNASVLILEAADDVSQGATKGNSGIVHAGFDDTPGSVRSKFCWPGNQMFAQLDKELRFGYQKNGSLVIARGPADEAHLVELLQRGKTNGVRNLRIIGKEELFQLEPHVHPESTAALLAEEAGNLIPYEYTIALIENAVQNGVEVRIRREVVAVESEASVADGEAAPFFTVKARHWEPKPVIDAGLANASSDASSEAPADPKGVLATHLLNCLVFGLPAIFVADKVLHKHLTEEQITEPIRYCLWAITLLLVLVVSALVLGGQKKKSGKAAAVAAKPLEAYVAGAPEAVGSGGRKITVEEMKVGGSGSSSVIGGETVNTETFRARYVINCAGSAADKVAGLIGDKSFYIKPRIGDYILLNKNQGHLATRTLFPCPGPLGKGVLVQTTLWGNLILGPTARDLHDPAMMAQTPEEIQNFIFSKCKELVPTFDPKETIHAFCGVRAKSSRNDWIIEPSALNSRFIHAAGIDSPGLAGSPAIALEVVRLLGVAGLKTTPNESFDPNRYPMVTPKSGWKGIRAGPLGKFTQPSENIVCKCEKVTEAEVIAAVRGPLPVDSTQAIRKRTRAGMGHCQANTENYDCERRVAGIIARELGIPVEAVGRRPWPATSTLPQRWIDDTQKQRLSELMEG